MTITTEKIWNEFHRELLRFIRKRVKDDDVAKDLLQDIFIKIHLRKGTLNDADKLTSWVFQITRNSILDYFKKKKPERDLPQNVADMDAGVTYNNEFADCLKPFIQNLPILYRDAIIETEMNGMSQKEFAEKMNISHSGAKSRVQRGRQQLVELFNQCCHYTKDSYGNIVDYDRRSDCKVC